MTHKTVAKPGPVSAAAEKLGLTMVNKKSLVEWEADKGCL